MHEVRGPEAPRPDAWGVEAYLPQTAGTAGPQTQIEQVGKLAAATGAGRDGSFGVVVKVGTAAIVLAFLVLVLALLLT